MFWYLNVDRIQSTYTDKLQNHFSYCVLLLTINNLLNILICLMVLKKAFLALQKSTAQKKAEAFQYFCILHFQFFLYPINSLVTY